MKTELALVLDYICNPVKTTAAKPIQRSHDTTPNKITSDFSNEKTATGSVSVLGKGVLSTKQIVS